MMLYKMANSVPVRRLGHTSSFFFPLATSEALKTGGGVGVEVGVARDQEGANLVTRRRRRRLIRRDTAQGRKQNASYKE
jgi:hypothetical protein